MEPYTAQEREIFRYFTGKAWRWADPVAVRRRMALSLVPQSLEDVLGQCRAKDEPVKLQAREFLVNAARIAFEMPCNPDADKPEQYGATENQVVDALNAYIAFNKKKATTGANGPTGSEPTASIRSAPGESPSPSSTAAG